MVTDDEFNRALRERNPELFKDPADTRLVLTSGEVETLPAEMRGVNQLLESVDKFIPAIEKITGLTRRDIFLQLIKTGFRGGNMAGFLEGLMGHPPEKPSKFEKYVKTLAVWIPVSIGLFGLVIVLLFALWKVIGMVLV